MALQLWKIAYSVQCIFGSPPLLQDEGHMDAAANHF